MAKRTKKNFGACVNPLTAGKSIFGQDDLLVTIMPNMQAGEIWISSQHDPSHGIAIRVSVGYAGIGVAVRRQYGTPALTVASSDDGYNALPLVDGAREVDITQYKQDARSQAFKTWYHKRGELTDEQFALLGKEYRRDQS